jgi:hypothetical protein
MLRPGLVRPAGALRLRLSSGYRLLNRDPRPPLCPAHVFLTTPRGLGYTEAATRRHHPSASGKNLDPISTAEGNTNSFAVRRFGFRLANEVAGELASASEHYRAYGPPKTGLDMVSEK